MLNVNINVYKRFIVTIFILGCISERFLLIDGAMTLEQMQKTATGIRNSCITKTGVKTEYNLLVKIVFRNDSYLLNVELVDGLKAGQFPEDHDLQCYTQCVMKTIRTFKNQKVDVDMVIKQVEMMMPVDMQDAMKASARKCGALEPADDICVTAFNYVKCNYNENPEIFFFP